ncbi:hypothetical protein QTP88_010698 [Uroleucon formosanum]
MQESTNEVDASQQTASPSVGNLATKLLQSKNTQVTLTSQTLSLAALSEDQLLNKMREQIQSMSNFTLKTKNCRREVKDGVADLVRIFNCYVPKRIAQIKISVAAKMKDHAEIQGENPSLAKKGKDVETCTPCWWDLNDKPRTLKQKLGLNYGIENTWANSVGRKANRRPPKKSPSPPLLYKPMENGIRTNISNGGTPVVPCLLIKAQKTQEIASENENAFNIDDPPATEAELSPSSSLATLINDGAGCNISILSNISTTREIEHSELSENVNENDFDISDVPTNVPACDEEKFLKMVTNQLLMTNSGDQKKSAP